MAFRVSAVFACIAPAVAFAPQGSFLRSTAQGSTVQGVDERLAPIGDSASGIFAVGAFALAMTAGVAASRRTYTARHASAAVGEQRMSPSVPYLRYPTQLEGWVGEEKGFDPLGVTDALPVYLVREAELKHGRIAMLATIGWIATDLGARFPGETFQRIGSTVEAHNKAVEAGYMMPFLGAIGVFEVYSLWLIFNGWSKEIKRDAGDYFFGKKFLPKDSSKNAEMRLKELENGRLAMLAFGGIVTEAVITGKAFPFL